MDFETFNALAWLVAGQFVLYAVGWAAFGLLLREERAAVAHWGAFMLLMGLGFVLAAGRDAERAWWPYVGANIAFVVGFAALRRGLALFHRAPLGDGEQLALVAAVVAGLVFAGAGNEQAAWRALLTYGAGCYTVVRALVVVSPGGSAEFGWRTQCLIGLPGALLCLGFAARALRQGLDWSHPLEMQFEGGINRWAMLAYLFGAAMFNFSFMALVTARLTRRLREQAQRDALTGLPNRRALESDLQRAWRRLRAGAGGFALLALDLDHFKRVNDQHGHLAGDAVLEQMGARLRAAVRDHDTVARTGGEEFIVLMPGADAERAAAVAERLLDAVRSRPFELPGGPLPLTVSVGLALAEGSALGLQQVLQRADQALYRAKSEGRNRLVLAAA